MPLSTIIGTFWREGAPQGGAVTLRDHGKAIHMLKSLSSWL